LTRLLPAVVAVFLMLIFLAINQAILSNQQSKNIATLPNSETNSTSEPVRIDNDQRGAHSYFLPPRLFSARYSSNGTLAVNQPNQSLENFGTPAKDVRVLPMRTNAQDLLQSGYLRDNEASYLPDFGAARSK